MSSIRDGHSVTLSSGGLGLGALDGLDGHDLDTGVGHLVARHDLGDAVLCHRTHFFKVGKQKQNQKIKSSTAFLKRPLDSGATSSVTATGA